jgi:histidinol-phosphate phosphatase family protein
LDLPKIAAWVRSGKMHKTRTKATGAILRLRLKISERMSKFYVRFVTKTIPRTVKAAIFLERDGILNLARVDKNQQVPPLTLDQFKVNPLALAPLLHLKAAGFTLIATTNQPAMSHGNISRWDLDQMHGILRRAFSLDDILICPHAEDEFCPCRKPKAGLFSEAAFKWHIDLEHSFVISDKWQDAEAARLVGATSLLVKSPWIGRGHHDFVLPDIAAIAEKIADLQPCKQSLVA